MVRRRTMLEAATALFDADYDGTRDQDEFFRSVWSATDASYQPGMSASDLVRAARVHLRGAQAR